MSSGKEIRDLNKIYMEAVYGQSAGQKLEKREKDDDAAGAPYTVTAADKKGNTPAYQGLKAGKKNVKTGKPLYKAADHLKDDKDWGYDKDGNSLNPVDIEKKKKKDDDLAGAPKNEAADLAPTVKKNFGAEDIAKAHHKEPMPTLKKNPLKNEELEQVRKLTEKVLTPGAKLAKLRADDELFGAPKKSWNKVRKVADQEPSQKVRDRQGKWSNEEVESEVEETNDPGMEHNLSVLDMISEKGSVLKKEVKDLKKGAETLKGKNVAKADALLDEYIPEKKDKDTPDQVKAVIAFDKARKGTDDATYDSEHGDKEQAKKERDYAKWQRDKGAEDAQKSGHPWEHAKGSTREKEGKKSEKHAHIKDSFDRESQLWDEVAVNLTELHELGGVKFKVVPFDLEEDKKWIQGAVKRPGAFTKKAKEAGMSVQQFAAHVDANKDKYSTRTERQANLAQTFASMKKEGAEYDALSEFLINEGADEEAVNHIMANWLLEGYQRNPEEGERKERESAKKREAIPGQARRGMPPRGDKKREEFEKWYAANVR